MHFANEVKEYYKSGNLKSKVGVLLIIKIGKWVIYRENGKIKKKKGKAYNKGKKTGEWLYYDDNENGEWNFIMKMEKD